MNLKLLITSVLLAGAISPACWAAEDGAALYKKKCGGCHGASGQGKPAIKAPALKGTGMDADKLATYMTDGMPTSKAPHTKGISGVSAAQAKAIADYVKTLQ